MTEKKFDPTKPVQTRDGREVRILATDSKGTSNCVPNPIIADVRCNEGWTVRAYRADGLFWAHGGESHLDLVNIPERETYWSNVYKSGAGFSYTSPEEALASMGSSAIGQIKYVVEDGKIISVELVELSK